MTMNSWQLLLNAGVHPAVLARVCRWGRPHSDDLATEILYLAHTDAIKVHWGQHEDSLTGRRVEDYRLSRSASAVATSSDPLDAVTLKMLFDVVAGGADELWLNDMRRFAKRDADSFRKAMLSWQAEMADAIKRQGAFSPLSVLLQQALPLAAVACLLAGLLVWLATGMPVYFAGLAVVAVALIAVGRQMPRLSPEAAGQYEAAKQLQSWLRAFDAKGCGTDVPTDQAFWNRLMPLAFMLGEADAAMAAFEAAGFEAAETGVVESEPSIGVGGRSSAATNLCELTWPAWYRAPWANVGSEDSASPSLAGLLPELIASTAFAANEAVSSDMAFAHALTALIFPLNSLLALLGVPRISIPGVVDPSTMTRSSAELFKRRS